MHSTLVDGSDPSNDLLVEIVDTLETQGLDPDAYQLHEYVDVEALEQILYSSSEDIEVQFTVGGIRLSVSSECVDIVDDDSSIEQNEQ